MLSEKSNKGFPKKLCFVTMPEKMEYFFRFFVVKSAVYIIFKTHFYQGCVCW